MNPLKCSHFGALAKPAHLNTTKLRQDKRWAARQMGVITSSVSLITKDFNAGQQEGHRPREVPDTHVRKKKKTCQQFLMTPLLSYFCFVLICSLVHSLHERGRASCKSGDLVTPRAANSCSQHSAPHQRDHFFLPPSPWVRSWKDRLDIRI